MSGEIAEAEFVADAIHNMMGEGDLNFADFAVLYRSNNLSREIEKAFRMRGIPYRMIGGQEFFKRKEVKDAAAYLKLIVNPKDDQSLLRIINIPGRGLGDKAIDALKELRAKGHAPMTELLSSPEYLSQLSAKSKSSVTDFSQTMLKYREVFAAPGSLGMKVQNYLFELGYTSCFQKLYKNIKEAEARQANVDQFIDSISAFEHRFPEGKEVTRSAILWRPTA